MNATTEISITFRPHCGKAATRTTIFSEWVIQARDWWRYCQGDRDETAQGLGAPAYDAEEMPSVDDESDAADAWWDEQYGLVWEWLGTLDGVERWAGYDAQPAFIRVGESA